MKLQIKILKIAVLGLLVCNLSAWTADRRGPAKAAPESEPSFFESHVRATYEYKNYIAANPKLSPEERKAKYDEVFLETGKLYQRDIRAMRKEYLGAYIDGAAKPQKKNALTGKSIDKNALEEQAKQKGAAARKKREQERRGQAGNSKTVRGGTAESGREPASVGTGTAATTRIRADLEPPVVGGADAVSFNTPAAENSKKPETPDPANSGGANAVKFGK